MNFLKAEIERKRKQLQEKQVVGPDKKYFKRGDLLQKEKDEYFKRHQPKEEDVKNLVEISEAKSKHKEERKSLFREIIKSLHSMHRRICLPLKFYVNSILEIS